MKEGLRCPKCKELGIGVTDSRFKNGVIRRVRKCLKGHRFSTREYIVERRSAVCVPNTLDIGPIVNSFKKGICKQVDILHKKLGSHKAGNKNKIQLILKEHENDH